MKYDFNIQPEGASSHSEFNISKDWGVYYTLVFNEMSHSLHSEFYIKLDNIYLHSSANILTGSGAYTLHLIFHLIPALYIISDHILRPLTCLQSVGYYLEYIFLVTDFVSLSSRDSLALTLDCISSSCLRSAWYLNIETNHNNFFTRRSG